MGYLSNNPIIKEMQIASLSAGIIRLLMAVAAGLCLGDTWLHSTGITLAVILLMPYPLTGYE